MREIKFRGKSMGGHWKYGLLTKKKIRNSGKLSYAIATDDFSSANTIPISEGTIGQFTGFKDIDGTEIFEGDILQHADIEDFVCKVELFRGAWFGNDFGKYSFLADLLESKKFKVIGNIHDNKELLGDGSGDD